MRQAKLKELINPFILRRTKAEVALELPAVFEQVRYVDMTEAQKQVYEEEKSLARNSILENLEEAGNELTSMMVLQALTKRQTDSLQSIRLCWRITRSWTRASSMKFAGI